MCVTYNFGIKISFVTFFVNYSVAFLLLNDSRSNSFRSICPLNSAHINLFFRYMYKTDVTVKDVVFKSVEQTESKVLVATIVGDGSKVTAKDVVITNTDNKVINPVKKVSVDSKDKTKLVIEAYNSMTDGKTYSVKYMIRNLLS